MSRYPGFCVALSELVTIVREHLDRDGSWSMSNWIRREMNAASPEDVTDIIDRACTEVLAGVPEFRRRSALGRLEVIRSEAQRAIVAEADRQGAPEILVDAMHEMLRVANPDLLAHLVGVGTLAGRIAQNLGLDAARSSDIAAAGRLLDAGKLAVPADVLNARCVLGVEQEALIRSHCVAGERMVAAIPELRRFSKWIRSHHERLDGSGYPDRLRGEEIPIEVRILSVADVFDAMVTKRPYRKPHTAAATLEHLADGAGRLYDPVVTNALERVLRPKERRSGSPAAA